MIDRTKWIRKSRQATDRACARPPPPPGSALQLSLFRPRRPDFGGISTAEPQFERRSAHHGGRDQSSRCMKRCAANPRIIVFGEDVADCSREAIPEGSERQGRRLQSHGRACRSSSARSAASTRRIAEAAIVGRAIGLADARAEALAGDPVLRLHLAGHDADSRRTGHAALAFEQCLQRARW